MMMRTTGKTAPDASNIYVWDLVVRLFHWITVISFALAYFFDDNRSLHKFFGYTLLMALIIRLFWGFIGSYHARFLNFIPLPTEAVRYLLAMIRGHESRHLGHNPAGAMMIVALIIALSTISATGYMMGMDRYWGEEWVEQLHADAVNITLLLLVLHLGGVVYASWKHRENLVRSMMTGWKSKT